MHRIAVGVGIVFAASSQPRENSLSVMAFMGLPWPTKSTGMTPNIVSLVLLVSTSSPYSIDEAFAPLYNGEERGECQEGRGIGKSRSTILSRKIVRLVEEYLPVVGKPPWLGGKHQVARGELRKGTVHAAGSRTGGDVTEEGCSTPAGSRRSHVPRPSRLSSRESRSPRRATGLPPQRSPVCSSLVVRR